MNIGMATLILEKKLRELNDKLKQKNVTMHLHEDAKRWLLQKGFTPEYGAREMERVLASNLKPLLMREILFGKLKKGGEIEINVDNDKLSII
jgi:ATP-dependent Clp protease ATP-binding subunit ClpA